MVTTDKHRIGEYRSTPLSLRWTRGVNASTPPGSHPHRQHHIRLGDSSTRTDNHLPREPPLALNNRLDAGTGPRPSYLKPHTLLTETAPISSLDFASTTPLLCSPPACAKADCPTLSPLLTTPKTGTVPLCPQLNILPHLSASLEPLRDRNTSSTWVLIRSRSLRPPLIPLIDTLILSMDKSVQAAQYTTRQRGVRATPTPDSSSNGPSYTRSERLE